MASSPPLVDIQTQRSSPHAPSRFPLSTGCCVFAPPASVSRWHRPCSNSPTPSDDSPASGTPGLLPPLNTSGSSGAAAELYAAGSPDKRSFYSAFGVNEEILDDDGLDECIQHLEKRTRRLNVAQVKALEKAFERDNRLEPERKDQLANELSLQPRQVAVWFQNRRARWKTKQMEKDYYTLKKKLESLKVDKDELMKEKEKLEEEVIRLRKDLRNREKVQLETATKAGRVSQSEVSSYKTARDCFEQAEPNSSSDLKDKDRSSITCDSEGSAIDDNVEPVARVENRGGVNDPRNVTTSADIALMQTEAYGFLDLPDLYHGRTACCPRASEDFFSAEVETYSGFFPYDWWEAS